MGSETPETPKSENSHCQPGAKPASKTAGSRRTLAPHSLGSIRVCAALAGPQRRAAVIVEYGRWP
jgi:hypothetical protein